MVNLLLAKGANINAFDKKDGRALHWAAFMGERQRRSLFETYHAFYFLEVNQCKNESVAHYGLPHSRRSFALELTAQ